MSDREIKRDESLRGQSLSVIERLRLTKSERSAGDGSMRAVRVLENGEKDG